MKSLLEHLNELVPIKSTFDRPEELKRVVDYVEAQFDGYDSLTKKRYERKEKHALVVSTQDTLTPDILMMAHLDVVPADDDLFVVRQEGNNLFGRGVCDNKGPAAVIIRLMQEISGWENPPSIAAVFTSDEEVGGFNGANHLINDISYRPKVGLVPDNGQTLDHLVLENKGVVMFRLVARGKQGHGSRPWEGENAIDKLIQSYLKIKDKYLNTSSPEVWDTTINIGMIGGGQASNQIPDEAFCAIDLRFPEGSTAQQVIDEVKDLVPECEVESIVSGEASKTDPESPYVKAYEEVIGHELKIDVEHGRECAAHDGRYLSAVGVPIIVSRPLSGAQHSPDEWMDLESLKDFENLYRAYIKKLQGMMS